MYPYYINKTYRRSGNLWEGTHKASLVDTDNYLHICYRYRELNPVLADMVATPDQYRWSSYCYHVWLETNTLINDHHLYYTLDKKPKIRQKCYHELFRHHIPEGNVHQIRQSLAYNFPLGDDGFQKQTEKALGRRAGFKERERPKRA